MKVYCSEGCCLKLEQARAEVAALREVLGRDLKTASDRVLVLEVENQRARALLARLASAFGAHESYLRCDAWAANDGALVDEARAFLDPRRDDLAKAKEAIAGMSLEEFRTRLDEERKTASQMRDEARRCTCDSPIDGMHDAGCDLGPCPKCVQAQYDEARRARVTESIKRIADKYHETLARLGDDARDEARRCTCEGPRAYGEAGRRGERNHADDCPARDEARHVCTEACVEIPGRPLNPCPFREGDE